MTKVSYAFEQAVLMPHSGPVCRQFGGSWTEHREQSFERRLHVPPSVAPSAVVAPASTGMNMPF